MKGDQLTRNNHYLYDVKNNVTQTGDDNQAKWIAIVDVTDPIIEKVEMDPGKKDITAQVSEYFTVTYYKDITGKTGFGIKVTPKTSALDPTKIDQIRFTLKSTAKLVHQWGHTTNVKNGNGFTVYYGKPYSTENLSRRARR